MSAFDSDRSSTHGEAATRGADAPARMLAVLERLLALPAADLRTALTHATDLLAQETAADKVDAFLYDPARDSLVAVSSSNQPLSALQRKHGLDVLPVSNGGRVVSVYTSGKTYLNGRVDEDPEELRGIKETLRIRSKIGVALEFDGRRRGMIMIASLKPDHFTEADARFAERFARWVGFIAHRAELVQEITRNSVAQGRRGAAEELITVFAHDMRNHLTPIVTRLQFLEKRAERDHRDFAIHELGLALRALNRMRSMINDILDVARIDGGLLEISAQPLDLAALVEETAATFSTPEHPIGVRSKLEAALIVAVDPGRLRQCLENLFSNAVKHSPANAPVTVLLSAEPQQAGTTARVLVVDEGPGVAPHLLPRIFERFATGGAEGGLGLGLYLAKRIAQLHGGDLTVDSEPGKGARFMLSLPVYRQGSLSD